MKKENKKSFAEAFDSGHLHDLIDSVDSNTTEKSDYLQKLHSIEKVLRNGSEPFVPEGFATSVISRLPSSARVIARSNILSVVFKPLLLLVTIILSIIFAEPLGLAAVTNSLSSLFGSSGEFAMTVLYVVFTSFGILAMLVIMLNSTMSIRSRRVER